MKQFELDDLVGKQIVAIKTAFGGNGMDDYVGLDINDGTQVQIIGPLGSLILIKGELEEMLDRRIVLATRIDAESQIGVATFLFQVVSVEADRSTVPVTPFKIETLALQFALTENDHAVTVECKA